jgi:acyl-[acyl-carrier-protein]-phospholipid O-acyltransferase/long-chain-fatty-acid--[acyl-carrier-protein] ligase
MKGTLFDALLRARRRHGGSQAVLVDGDGRVLTYDDTVRAAFALGHALKAGTSEGETVGVMLPTGIGSVLGFLALHAYGRVPAMLNFTAGLQSLQTALATGKIKRIVTARRFIELAKLDSVATWLAPFAEFVYLEDVRENLSLVDKAAAFLGSHIPRAVRARVDPESPAVILFTSGTEGEPKGVALSHANILANIEQVRVHIALYPTDIVFNPLPTFHSLGLTVGVLAPLYLGIKTVLHPTPLQPHEIVKRIREYAATILLSTDTFVSQYARVAEPEDLESLRLAVCGAERLRDETRQLVRRKFLVELLEGYGVTEASPVVAANQVGNNRVGTVGRFMPAIDWRIEPVEGIANGGRLFLRGPNIMLGYIKADHPMEIVPLDGGWHDTGDVVGVDDEGYLSIRGRLKRFAKVGGETVSLAIAENCASAVWPDAAHAALAIPDGRKGEQIVLITTQANAERGELVAWAHNHGVSELALPRRIVHASEIPILGTGKTDYVSLQKMLPADLPS